MAPSKSVLLKAALSTLHYSGADRLLAPMTRGNGVIFMMHHVSPEPPAEFEPNRILKITPAFLDEVIRQVIANGYEIVSLDGVHERLNGIVQPERPFACFTFDDGYRDNREHAYPIFKRHNAPFAIYVPTDYADGVGDLWWLVLEEVLRRSPEVAVQRTGGLRVYSSRTTAEKNAAFDDIYWWLRDIPEHRARQVVSDLARCAGIDAGDICRRLVMTWDELRALASDPLVTIGAHTHGHYALAKLDAAAARSELAGSVARIERELGRTCAHFSYPYGDEASAGEREFTLATEIGLKTAVTTRKGLIHSGMHSSATRLPRVSLNGDYQDARYVKVLLSGAPFAFWNALRRPSPAPSY